MKRLSHWLTGQRIHLQCRRHRRCKFDSWVRKIPWRKKWQPTPVFLPRESHEQRGAWCAAVYRVAQSRTRLKQLGMHACVGEGNGNTLQCSCLENPRDRGAWWAAVYGVAQSRTRLKRLSSSSSSNHLKYVYMKIHKGIHINKNDNNCY